MGDHFEGRARSDSSDVAMRKIFIGGLSYSTDEEKLKRYFRDYGIVQDAVVMKDPVSKRSRGFGFITFYDPISVDSVLAAEPHLIDGRKVEAKRAVPRSEMTTSTISGAPGTPLMAGKIGGPMSSPSIEHFKSSPGMAGGVGDDMGYNKIFVGGLHYDTRDQEFKEYFGRFGRIVHGEVMFNRETHKSRGFGFIVFENADSAIRACDVREHIIDGKVVEVKLAIPRSKIGPTTPGPSSSLLSMSNTVSPSTLGRSRTLSASSAQVHSPSITLSGNSSTLAASSGSHKVGPGQLSFGTTGNSNGLNGSLRKPTSIGNLGPLGPTPTRSLAPSSASYATALRFSNGVADEDTLLSCNSTEDNMTISYFEQLVVDSVRPSRAQSEPIVKYDNGNQSNSFGGDLMNFGSFLHQPPANTPQLPSQNVSRSNSIAMPNGTLNLGNSLSPESNPLATSGFASGSLAEKLFGDGGESASLFRTNSNNNNTSHGMGSTSGSLSSILFASPTEAGEFNFSSLPPPIISPRDGAPPRIPFPAGSASQTHNTENISNNNNHSSNVIGNASYTKSPSQQFILSGGSQPSLLSSGSTDIKISHTPSRDTISSVLGIAPTHVSPRSSFTIASGTDPWSASSSHNHLTSGNNHSSNTSSNNLSWGDDTASLRGFEQRPRGGSFFAETTNDSNSGTSTGLGVIGASRTSSRDQDPSSAAAALLNSFGAQASGFSWTTNSASELDSAVSYSLLNNDVNVGAPGRFRTASAENNIHHSGSLLGGGIGLGSGLDFGNHMAQHLEPSRQSSSDSLLGDRLNWDGNN